MLGSAVAALPPGREPGAVAMTRDMAQPRLFEIPPARKRKRRREQVKRYLS
jgi:hypothetical protein